MYKRLADFSLKIVDCHPRLAPLHSALSKIETETPPVVAIIGSYSSGKTSLLNGLLCGQEESSRARLFRTSTIVNTAVVSELRYVLAPAQEEVIFSFRDNVRHTLYKCSRDEDNRAEVEVTTEENAACLKDLIHQGVLLSPRIEWLRASRSRRQGTRIDKPSAVLEELGRFITDPLRKIDDDVEECSFYADVDRARIPLTERIDLSSPTGWSDFQGGDDQDTTPKVESSAATFLIERAMVRLHSPLLMLATIADTPGTGSWNDRHDVITDEYLNRADAFLLLMPTKNSKSTRVHQIINKLANHMKNLHKGDPSRGLDKISFVVNCFTTHGEDERAQKAQDYWNMVREAFYVSPGTWERKGQAGFFVVNMREFLSGGEHRDELYGFPSSGPLQEWVRRLLARTANVRLYKVRHVLDDDWRRIRRALESERERNQTRNGALQKEVLRVREYAAEKEITPLRRSAEEELLRLKTVQSGIEQCVTPGCQILYRYVDQPHDKEDVNLHLTSIVAIFKDINESLVDLQDCPPLDAWLADVRRELDNRGVAAPALSTPDPANQEHPWAFNWRLDPETVKGKAADIQERWPCWFRRCVECLPGTTDKRSALAEEFRSHVQGHFSRLQRALTPYLERCEKQIGYLERKVREECVEYADRMSRTGDATNVQKVEKATREALTDLDVLEKNCSELLKDLEKSLDDEQDENG